MLVVKTISVDIQSDDFVSNCFLKFKEPLPVWESLHVHSSSRMIEKKNNLSWEILENNQRIGEGFSSLSFEH